MWNFIYTRYMEEKPLQLYKNHTKVTTEDPLPLLINIKMVRASLPPLGGRGTSFPKGQAHLYGLRRDGGKTAKPILKCIWPTNEIFHKHQTLILMLGCVLHLGLVRAHIAPIEIIGKTTQNSTKANFLSTNEGKITTFSTHKHPTFPSNPTTNSFPH